MSRVHRPHIIEVKRALGGASAAERRFECELIEATPMRAVVLFRFVRDGRAFDSYGVFWRRRAYNCYYAVESVQPARANPLQGRPAFVRFDVVRDVEIDLRSAPAEVRYTDLLLDLWVDGSGARWEDEDEVGEAARNGTLTAADQRRIKEVRALLERSHRRIATEVRRLIWGLRTA